MKNKKITFIIVVAICLAAVIAVTAFTACENEELHYKVAFFDGYDTVALPFDAQSFPDGQTDGVSDTVVKIDSHSELLALCAENGFPFFNQNDENYYSALAVKIREYEEKFFETKAVVLIIKSDSGNVVSEIEKAELKGETLEITLAKPDVNGESEEKATFVYVIELDKKETENIKEIRLNEIRKGTQSDYQPISTFGEMSTLESAYEKGWLIADDIRSIGFYHNGGKEWTGCVCGKCDDENYKGLKCLEGFEVTDYVPQEKNPACLSDESVEKIKKVWVDYLFASADEYGFDVSDFIDINNLEIEKYYGTYNGCAVFMFGGIYLQTVSTYEIADTVFFFADSNRILVWKE